MARLPFLQFFPNDWLAEPAVRVCSLAARGLAIDMLSLMHLSPRRGYLLAATGLPHTPEQLARLTGCSADEVTRLLAELKSSGVFSWSDDGTIYSRRMVRDEGKREKCSEAGKKGGGNPALGRGDGDGSGGVTTGTFKGGPKGGPKGGSKGGPKPPEARGQITSSSKKCGSDDPAAGEPEKPDKTPTNPSHKPAVDAFCAAWKVKHGCAYKFTGGKDAKIVADVLAHLGNDLGAFRALVARYLADDDPFVVKNGHDLGMLALKLNRYTAASAKPRSPGRSGFVDFDIQPPMEAA